MSGHLLFERGAYMNLHFAYGVYMYRSEQNGTVKEMFTSPNPKRAAFSRTYLEPQSLSVVLARQTADEDYCYGEYFNAGRNITYQKFKLLSDLLQ